MSPRLRGRHRRADLPAMLVSLDEAVEALEGRADTKALRQNIALEVRQATLILLDGMPDPSDKLAYEQATAAMVERYVERSPSPRIP